MYKLKRTIRLLVSAQAAKSRSPKILTGKPAAVAWTCTSGMAPELPLTFWLLRAGGATLKSLVGQFGGGDVRTDSWESFWTSMSI